MRLPPLLHIGGAVLCISLLTITTTPRHTIAQVSVATTTLTVGICGDTLVDGDEECDVPGETGQYSTTIAGRQCNEQCQFGPYCGDAILQTLFGEECDDGNNDDGDFCSSLCTIEPAGSGGGGSSGGGSGRSGGSDRPLGDTQISVEGFAYPNQTVHVILDAREVGTIRADNRGQFEFAVDSAPGTASLGLWSLDSFNTRSITFNTTFDVTQGAITTVRGILLPPSISADQTEVNPGDVVTLRGQTSPNSLVELHLNNQLRATTTSSASGVWQVSLNTANLSPAEYTAKARFITGIPPLIRQSNFSSNLSLFVGVDGRATTPTDLNRDGSINLVDFSILIFWWQTNGGNSNPPADINGNGNVGIEDFSILLFNWTG
jgi:cysteine-rich repeat protein